MWKTLYDIFVFPGKIASWFQYYFPKNVTDAIGAARRRRNPEAIEMLATNFWICILGLILFSLASAFGYI